MTATALQGLTTGTWTIDTAHSELGFVARHLMVTKVRGSFQDFAGTITVADQLVDSKAEVTIQTASITTRNADRDAHLKSGDFFEIESNPTITFVSTSFDGSTLVGDLTVKGVTKPVSLDVEFNGVQTDPWGGTRAGFEATGTINRSDWNLNWNAALEGGGVLVSEKINLAIDIELVKQA